MRARSQLTQAQLADIDARRRDGRPDIASMTNEERRAAGLMDLRQAAEQEHFAAWLEAAPENLGADRSRGPDPEDLWAGADDTIAIWRAWAAAGHTDCDGWHQDQDGPLVCACGEVVALTDGEETP